MDSERWDLVQRVFHEALEVPEESLRDFVRAACEDTPEIETEVLALVAQDRSGDSILDQGVGHVADALFEGSTTVPRNIGPYRVTRKLGEGGMGVVYLAEREDLDSLTAIKFLRDAKLSPERRERFFREQRILAQLSHPSISRLYDASTLADGTPYFVMEYIDGLALTDFCERHELPVEQRLRLFRQVCEAVQYAHRQALIHRDLKPSNILALDGGEDGEPSIKLLDFGVAKQAEPEEEALSSTQTKSGPMTPPYAAPEQMRGQAVGVSTDVYSLGVLLYELLTASLPFNLSGLSFFEAAKTKSSRDPERPSARISRQGAMPRFASAIGKRAWTDLDVLCLTAMNKDPDQRYPTVEALLRDVDHYLGDRALEARAPSIGYLGRKFIARHRWSVGAAALALVVLLSFTVTVTLQADRLAAERDRANRAATASENVTRFLTDSFKISDPARAQGETVTARELLDKAAAELDDDDDVEPELRAQLLDVMGQVYHKLGLFAKAESLVAAALKLREGHLGKEHPQTLETGTHLGAVYLDQTKFEPAVTLLAEVLAGQLQVLAAEHPQTLETTWRLAEAYMKLARYSDAEPLFQNVVDARTRQLGDHHLDTLGALGNQAVLYRHMGRYEEAETIYRRILPVHRDRLGSKHPNTFSLIQNLGMVLISQKRFAEAEPLLAEANELGTQIHGERHQITLNTRSALAVALQANGHHDTAEGILKEVLKIQEEDFGPLHIAALGTKNNLADLYQENAHYEQARQLFEEVLKGFRQVLEEGHPIIALVIHNLGRANRGLGHYDLARARFEEAGQLWEARLGPEHPYIAENLEQYALLLRRMGDASAALDLETRARTIRESSRSPP